MIKVERVIDPGRIAPANGVGAKMVVNQVAVGFLDRRPIGVKIVGSLPDRLDPDAGRYDTPDGPRHIFYTQELGDVRMGHLRQGVNPRSVRPEPMI